MKSYAARYYRGDHPAYDIAVYPSRRAADAHPHDFELLFSVSAWRRLGCRRPREDETLAVELSCAESNPAK
jgi:hypothetical protein